MVKGNRDFFSRVSRRKRKKEKSGNLLVFPPDFFSPPGGNIFTCAEEEEEEKKSNLQAWPKRKRGEGKGEEGDEAKSPVGRDEDSTLYLAHTVKVQTNKSLI